MSSFTIGQRVNRIEDREIRGATIVSIAEPRHPHPGASNPADSVDSDVQLELEYDEGGRGWWSASNVEPINE